MLDAAEARGAFWTAIDDVGVDDDLTTGILEQYMDWNI